MNRPALEAPIMPCRRTVTKYGKWLTRTDAIPAEQLTPGGMTIDGMASVIAFVLGNIALLRIPVLPELPALGMLIPLCLYLLRAHWLRLLAGFCLGALLSIVTVSAERDLRLPAGQRVAETLRGDIIGLPRADPERQQFMLHVTDGARRGMRVRLAWFHGEEKLVPGQRWQLSVRLRPPRGSVNFDLFDYEQWLFANRIHATGYVDGASGENRRLGEAHRVDRFRHWLRERITAAAPPGEVATFLALVLGDTGRLTLNQWETLNRTGTTHLLIVSGLHVGLIAGLIFALCRWLGVPLNFSIGATLLTTAGYAAIAGWGLPVQRAYLMTAAVLLSLLVRRHLLHSHRFALALLTVILFDPLASLTSGFWLSFGAVFALLAGLGGRQFQSVQNPQLRTLQMTGSAQWVVYLALLPALGYLHQQLPLAALLVNLVAIPWVGMLLVPSLLLASLLVMVDTQLGQQLLQLSGFMTMLLWRGLQTFSEQPTILPVNDVSRWQLLVALAGIVLLLSPRGYLPRWPGLILLCQLLIKPPASNEPTLTVTFLDVGQGLSVLVESDAGALLYDTGAAVADRFSAVTQFVLPTLQRRGWSQLQALVVSHTDNDHAGGVEQLQQAVPTGLLITPDDCDHHWRLGRVELQALSFALPGDTENNNSCLLLIDFMAYRLLLTGDIESQAEKRLIREFTGPVTLLSVPHHGSLSSSSPALLNTLKPAVAVNSAGHLNRFGHPAAAVVARYRSRGIGFYNTASDGAVELTFSETGYRIRAARTEQPALWRDNGNPASND